MTEPSITVTDCNAKGLPADLKQALADAAAKMLYWERVETLHAPHGIPKSTLKRGRIVKNLIAVMVLAVASAAWGQTGSGSVTASNPNLTSPAEVIPALADAHPAAHTPIPSGATLPQIHTVRTLGEPYCTHGQELRWVALSTNDHEQFCFPKHAASEKRVRLALPAQPTGRLMKDPPLREEYACPKGTYPKQFSAVELSNGILVSAPNANNTFCVSDK